MIVDHLEPPYYAVIFTTIANENLEGYLETAERMEELAREQNGFLGIESARKERSSDYVGDVPAGESKDIGDSTNTKSPIGS